MASAAGRYDTASLLVSCGAPLDARDRLHQGTPLGWARHHGHNDPRLLRLLRVLGTPAEPADGTQ